MDIKWQEGKSQVKSITHLVVPSVLIQQGDDGLDVALCYQV